MERSTEAIVVGGGATGLTAAVALASAGIETTLVSAQAPTDHRTTALIASSVTALNTLGVWWRCRGHAAPLETMRIVDDSRRLWRAPEVRFSAQEIGLDAFGWNIENRHLLAALSSRAAEITTLVMVEDEAVTMRIGDEHVNVATHAGAAIRGRLLIGADGRASRTRSLAGIATTRRGTGQTALTFNLSHTRAHKNISTEFHTEHGPFTLVPLPGLRSSLVCVVRRREVQRLTNLNALALAEELERRAHSILGRFAVEQGRGVFELAVETAAHLATHRVVLVGEAAHTLPPIGAQELNLGLRDAATIAEIAGDARRVGKDVGAPDVTQEYERRRRLDVASHTLAVDFLNRSLLSDFLPVQGARGLGLYALDRVGPLRRATMRVGVEAPFSPRLMRGKPV